MTYHLPVLAAFTIAVIVSDGASADDAAKSWMRLSRNGQIAGYISTEAKADDDRLQILHEVRPLIQGQQFKGTSTVEYELAPSLSTIGAVLTTEKDSVWKESKLKFDDKILIESFTYRTATGERTSLIEHSHEGRPLVHLWSLPVVAPRILTKPGTAEILFPEFPNRYDDSNLGRGDSDHYQIRRSDFDGLIRFEVKPTQERQARTCVMTLDKNGKLVAIDLGRGMKIESATPDDAQAWLKSNGSETGQDSN